MIINRTSLISVSMVILFALTVAAPISLARHHHHHRPSRKKHLLVGAGAGAATGALVGGPVGAVVGAGVGAGAGELTYRHKRKKYRRHHRNY